MGVIKYKPTSDGRRFRSCLDFEQITTDKPTKSLLKSKKRTSGRNVNGRITVRRKGGGHKRKIRIIDFKRDKQGVPGRVATIEYDPNRRANICLVNYADGEKRYIIHPQGLKVGDTVEAGPEAPYSVGNAHQLLNIPLGELIHNIELRPGGGAKIVRSAGASAQLMAKVGKYVMVRLPSGEQRRILGTCMATIGVVGNSEWANVSLGKAGANRWRGKRPKVRGVAMNPVDHPHGGGEGKTSGGRHPVTPWGVPTKGYKTRKNKLTDKFIVRRRGKK